MGDPVTPKKLPQFVTAIAAGTGALASGTTISWISQIQKTLETDGYNGVVFTKTDSGWAGSLVLLAGVIMSLATGFICDKIGRKWTMIIMVVPLLLGYILIVAMQNTYMALIGRFITGLPLGTFCVVIPMYTAEISHASIRGALGSFFQLFLTFGIFIMHVTGYVCPILIHTLIAIGLAIAFAIIVFFQPESPLYLIKKDKMEAAEKVLQRLRGKDYDIKEEVEEIKKFLEVASKKEVHVWKALRTKACKRAMLIVLTSQVIQQLSGINCIGIYTTEILRASGFSESIIPIISIIFGLVQCIFVYISTLLIERLGRKILMMASASCLGLCTLTYGLFLMVKDRKLADEEEVGKYSIIPVIAYVLYIVFFSIGLGAIPWFLAAEMYPDDVKGLLCSLGGAMTWGIGFLVAKFYMDLAAAIGADIIMLFFTTVMFLGTAFLFVFQFETKGKTLDEVQQILNS